MSLITRKESQLILQECTISAIRESSLQSLQMSLCIFIINFIFLQIIQTLIDNMKEIICHISRRISILAALSNMLTKLISQFLQLRLIGIIQLIKFISILIKSIFFQIICSQNLLINISSSILTIHHSDFLTRGNKVKILAKIINGLKHCLTTLKAIQLFCYRVLQRNRLQHGHGINICHILIQSRQIIILIQNMIICSIGQNIRSGSITRINLNFFIHLIFHLLQLISSRLHSNHIVLLSRNFLKIFSTHTTISTICFCLLSKSRQLSLTLRIHLRRFISGVINHISHLNCNRFISGFSRINFIRYISIKLVTKSAILILHK